ncbi:LLM class flavin-dependent oxidoreductase [Glutamicibacter bergerei]|uniref:LLM class flavin-dependent oxidoreductase n=2 Tax=Glutamicibacter TaxID=1742989 RepID=A0ABV9MGV0_9MICC|nr:MULTISPECIES: LLM class flavin-dependent oxidoreductase [Glutamicibacter]PCC35238.1 alkane 1-monooxygenase [Glutamicibacter sp. BW77]GGJ46514.1 alkanal monooxygenase [Glutamicibacter ardleyensis]HBV09386.1 LLM class flavin-dependent oxidoreductase [Micrococcaceae bacterium]
MKLSILDLAPVAPNSTISDSFKSSVRLAQLAERTGYERVWYAEHHNMPTIASSATSLLISHVAHHTEKIRLGSGGVMLPNHSPLVIAEQFGTLAEIFGDRIDLGLGRAPGTDMTTLRALRREPSASDSFPHDVLELQAYLAGESRVPTVQAIPGAGTNVPLYILGSSLFGAQLAAQFGLPYSFASHFAPAALHQAIKTYREQFKPSAQLAEPYVIAGVGVIAADSAAEAHELKVQAERQRVSSFLGRNAKKEFTEAELDMVMTTPQAEQILDMMRYTAIGTGEQVAEYLQEFAVNAQADELITVHSPLHEEDRLKSVQLTADSCQLASVG